MAIEALRKIADRFFPPIEKRYPNAVLMRPSFFDSRVAKLLDEASRLSERGETEESRLRYAESAALQTAIFESISTDTQQGIRDKAEYGVMAVSGLVSAHENDQAREFEARLSTDYLIPEDAKQRAAKLIEFLDQSPQW